MIGVTHDFFVELGIDLGETIGIVSVNFLRAITPAIAPLSVVRDFETGGILI